jgi:hypothetical protein
VVVAQPKKRALGIMIRMGDATARELKNLGVVQVTLDQLVERKMITRQSNGTYRVTKFGQREHDAS